MSTVSVHHIALPFATTKAVDAQTGGTIGALVATLP